MRRALVSIRSESPSILMPTSGTPEAAEHRLLVVVCLANETAFLARRIHQIASQQGARVLLVGAITDGASEIELRQRVAVLAGFLRDAGSEVDVRIERGWDWLDGIRFMLSESDLVACCAAAAGPGAHAELPDRLSFRLHRPVYVIEEPREVATYRPSLLRRASPWMGSLAVILGFLWLQIRLSQGGGGIQTSMVLILSLPTEIGLIWFCNAALG